MAASGKAQVRLEVDRDGSVPIYYQLASKLSGMIAAGELPPGLKLPTEDELAELHKVSRVTVRGALRKLEAEGKIKRVKGRGTFVSRLPRRLRNIILVSHALPNCNDLTLQGLLSGVIVAAQKSGAMTSVSTGKDLPLLLDSAMRDQSLQTGVIFLRDREVSISSLDCIDKYGVPCLFEGMQVEGRNWLDIDNRSAMREVVDYLYGLGHREFGVYSTESAGARSHFQERREAIFERFAELGVGPDSVVEAIFPKNGDMESMAFDMAAPLFSGPFRPTAIICPSDFLALGVMQRCDALGLKIPGDVSVTGFDDIKLTRFLRPPLTSVRQDFYELGRVATETLIDLMDDFVSKTVRKTVKLSLSIRGSSGPCAPRSSR